MTQQIPSYSVWWAASFIIGTIGIIGVVLLFGAVFVLLYPQKANQVREFYFNSVAKIKHFSLWVIVRLKR